MPKTKNILDLVNNDTGPILDIVRLNSNDTPVIPFTKEYAEVHLHFVHEPDIESYNHCNAPDCVLCDTGRSTTKKLLLPVYLPISNSVGVLPISDARRPGSLLPQILNVIQGGHNQIVFIRKINNFTFDVTTKPLPKGTDNGAKIIKRFITEFDSDRIDISSVYQRLSNEQLAEVPEIKTMMDLKGIPLGS